MLETDESGKGVEIAEPGIKRSEYSLVWTGSGIDSGCGKEKRYSGVVMCVENIKG